MPPSTPAFFQSVVTADTPLPSGTETVVATVFVTTRAADERVALRGFAQLNLGAGATIATCRIRRGSSIAGALVGEANPMTEVASTAAEIKFDGQDQPGEVAGQPYVLTAITSGGASTCNYAELEAQAGGQ